MERRQQFPSCTGLATPQFAGPMVRAVVVWRTGDDGELASARKTLIGALQALGGKQKPGPWGIRWSAYQPAEPPPPAVADGRAPAASAAGGTVPGTAGGASAAGGAMGGGTGGGAPGRAPQRSRGMRTPKLQVLQLSDMPGRQLCVATHQAGAGEAEAPGARRSAVVVADDTLLPMLIKRFGAVAAAPSAEAVGEGAAYTVGDMVVRLAFTTLRGRGRLIVDVEYPPCHSVSDGALLLQDFLNSLVPPDAQQHALADYAAHGEHGDLYTDKHTALAYAALFTAIAS